MTGPDFILRPVRESDFDQLFYLVGTIGDGLTSLPKDSDFIAHRITDSLRGFDPRIHKPGGEIYLFVLENTATHELVGTSALLSRVGGFDPFYTYRIERRIGEYAPLDIRVELETLHLTKNHKGPTEICSLFLHRDYRAGGLGRLLSLARFGFMKAFPDRFDHEVLAEMRGFIDPDGKSPFWDAVGQKFFQKDYYTADILSGVGEKDFIEALMPSYPIYISLLPESARSVIGRVHPHTEPAKRILLKEGFHETDEVDIFDAGPILRAKRSDLKSWKAARTAPIRTGPVSEGTTTRVILNNRSLDFRALIADVVLHTDGSLTATREVAEALQPQPDAVVMYLPI